jgi:hypothetical protein
MKKVNSIKGEIMSFEGAKKINNKIEKVYKEAKETFVNDICEYSKENDLGISFITWTQYIPGFNDGDPCTFTVGEMYVGLTEETYDEVREKNEEYDYEEDWEGIYSSYCLFEYKNNSRSFKTKKDEKIFNFLKEIESLDESVLEAIFGYDVKIIIDVKAKEVKTEDYDCGY